MCYSLPRRNAGHEESMADIFEIHFRSALTSKSQGTASSTCHQTAVGLLALQTHGTSAQERVISNPGSANFEFLKSIKYMVF